MRIGRGFSLGWGLSLGRLLALAVSCAAALALVGPVGAAGASSGLSVERFDGAVLNQDGSTDTQAGSHPWEITTSFAFNTTVLQGETVPVEDVRDIKVQLPAGLAGNPSAVPQCRQEELPVCPAASQIGDLTINSSLVNGFGEVMVPVYNMVPPAGEPAQFAAPVLIVPVFIDVHVRTGGDYGVTASLSNVSSILQFYESKLTLWGVPADPGHDAMRGEQCFNGSFCFGGGKSDPVAPAPFLTTPSLCGGPLTTSAAVDSWQHPGRVGADGAPDLSDPSWKQASFVTHDGSGAPVGVDGCSRLGFSPSASVQPDTSVADSPSGLSVDIHIPQNEAPGGLAQADLKDASVALPAGVSVNPAAANGLGSCSAAQIGIDNGGPPSCPDASKIGSVEVDTPLLPDPLVGGVYVAQPGANPFGSLLAIYVTAQGDGALIKLAGHVVADPVTGQLTTTFSNSPQLPFSDFKLSFFGGPHAALATPEDCGTFTTQVSLAPWSGNPASLLSDPFALGSGCVAGFDPSFLAGTQSTQAGSYAPFVLSLSRTDTDENVAGLSVKLPPGVLARLAGVARCPDAALAAAAANTGAGEQASPSCPAGSLLGTVTTGAGVGSDPFYLAGKAYLTGPYKGAPFGLAIVVPALAGPFDLGTVVVRVALNIDRSTAQVTAVSDPLPRILQGIPLRIRRVDVTLDRPGFTFNPTSCEPLAVTGTITSTQGTQAQVASRFQANGCASLGFHPVFSASSLARTSRQGGAALDVKVAYPPGAQANIHSVAVTLPKQLPARLSTIQQACPEAVFNQNPASCDEGSLIGTGTAQTPIFNNPITGPAYLVSHGGAAFPDVDLVLQGEGVTVLLVGHVSITKAGITSATFSEVPDAPISAFELSLPEGPHSGLSAVGSLCTEPLTMPTTITGQNGAVIKQNTRIKVSGCTTTKKKARKHKHKHHKKKHKARKG
jgi:hypothetical protein